MPKDSIGFFVTTDDRDKRIDYAVGLSASLQPLSCLSRESLLVSLRIFPLNFLHLS
jgi:hypothetical protein